VARSHRARDSPVLGHRADTLAVDFEQHCPSIDTAVERRAHWLHACDQDAARFVRELELVRGLTIEIANVETEEDVLAVVAPIAGHRRLTRRAALLALARGTLRQ